MGADPGSGLAAVSVLTITGLRFVDFKHTDPLIVEARPKQSVTTNPLLATRWQVA